MEYLRKKKRKSRSTGEAMRRAVALWLSQKARICAHWSVRVQPELDVGLGNGWICGKLLQFRERSQRLNFP